MGATATEKILARASGKAGVKAGDVIYPEPDYIIMHDLHAHLFMRQLWEKGVKELWKPERVMVSIDPGSRHTTRKHRRYTRRSGIGLNDITSAIFTTSTIPASLICSRLNAASPGPALLSSPKTFIVPTPVPLAPLLFQ